MISRRGYRPSTGFMKASCSATSSPSNRAAQPACWPTHASASIQTISRRARPSLRPLRAAYSQLDATLGNADLEEAVTLGYGGGAPRAGSAARVGRGDSSSRASSRGATGWEAGGGRDSMAKRGTRRTVRLMMDLPSDVHRRLRARSAQAGQTAARYAQDVLTREVADLE